MITVPRGTRDIFGSETAVWRRVEHIIHELCETFGYSEIRTPMFEAEELFRRGVGETTDVVSKEMFTFTDRGGRQNALRPEGTAGAMRSYIENGMSSFTQPVKLFYVYSLFRQEKPQAGRYRQYNSFGAEVIGSGTPSCDAELISLAYELFLRLKIKNVDVHLNSLGCPTCRQNHNKALRSFLEGIPLCDTCKERSIKNPMRVLDCKEAECKKNTENAPFTLDFLDDGCIGHFEEVKKTLNAMGIPFIIDRRIVRGLDYYTHTVFEFICKDEAAAGLGNQNVMGGGGRYDGLSRLIGGPQIPGAGFGLGIERIILTLEAMGSDIVKNINNECDIFIGAIGDFGSTAAQAIVYSLRQENHKAVSDISERSVKAQMKYADKLNARFSAILGDDEISKGKCSIKNMETGETCEVDIIKINEFLQKKVV